MKLSDLIEQRAAIVARMTEAHAADNGDAFTAAENELRALDGRIARARALDAADRAEVGRPINGDTKLDAELRTRFSLCRAVAGAAGLNVDWGYEREVQAELATRAGRLPQGVYIPHEVFETRVQVASSDPAGGYLVATEHRPDQYISALAASSVVRGLGARVLTGLVGNIDIPKETGAPVIGWVGENQALNASDAAFGSLNLSPKHAGALAEWSRNMLLQSSPQIETLLRQMLARDLALAIDKAAIMGGGAAEPTGVLTTAGIQTVAAPGSIFEGVGDAVAKADAENVGASRAVLTTPELRKTASLALDLEGRPIGVAAVFHNVPTTFSNQVPKTPEHGLIYADWSEMLIGVWSEIDILTNPYEASAYSKGNIMVRAMSTCDIGIRHVKAFVSVAGVTTATPAMPDAV